MPSSFPFTALHPQTYCHLQNHLIFFLRATSHLHPLLALSHPPSFLCPALHCHCAHRGCDISATSPPPHFTHLPPLPFLRALGCTVPVNRWVVIQALSVCMDVCLSDKWSKIFLRWWVPTSVCEPYTYCQKKRPQNLFLKHISMCYEVRSKVCMVTLQNNSPCTHCNHISPPSLRTSHSINAFSATSPVASAR